MRHIHWWAPWILLGALLLPGPDAEAGPIKEGDTVFYEGHACWNGERVKQGEVSENDINRLTILDSHAHIELDVSRGRATGTIFERFRSEVVDDPDGTRNYVRHTYTLDGDFRTAELTEASELGFHLLAISSVYTMKTSHVDHVKEKGTLILAVFQGAKAPPGYADLGSDFILVYKRIDMMRAPKREFAQAVGEGRLGYPSALLRRTDRPSAPGESADPEPPASRSVGDPSKQKWVVKELVGTVEVSTGDGVWVPVVKEMVLGPGVSLRTGKDSTAHVQLQLKAKNGKDVGDWTLKSVPETTVRIRKPEEGPGWVERHVAVELVGGKVEAWIGNKLKSAWEAMPKPEVPDWDIPFFDVVTPTVRVSSRQGSFDVAHDPGTGRTRLSVKEGKLEVEPQGAGLPATTLAPGDSAAIGATRMTVDGPSGHRSYGGDGSAPREPEPTPSASPDAGAKRTASVPRLKATVGMAVASDLEASGHPGPALVMKTIEAGPLRSEGIRAGDILVSVNNRDIASPEALQEALKGIAAGEEVVCVFLRGDDVLVVALGL